MKSSKNSLLIFVSLLFLFFLIATAFAETTFFDEGNMFIMSNIASGEVVEASTSGSSGGGCKYAWNCTNWGECSSSGKQTRDCFNVGTCSNTYNSPATSKDCVYPVPTNEEENKTKNMLKPEETSVKGIIDKNRMLFFLALTFIICFLVFNFLRLNLR